MKYSLLIHFLLVLDCGNPPELDNTVSVFNATTYGEIALYRCAAGYQTIRNGSLLCTHEAIWKGNLPQCRGIYECTSLFCLYFLVPLWGWLKNCFMGDRYNQPGYLPFYQFTLLTPLYIMS